MEKGAFGWAFQDQIQPLLDDYDRQINDILSNGVHGELARMQVMNDITSDRGATNVSSANGINSSSNVATAPSLVDAARSAPFNLRDSDLAAIRNRSDIQQGVQLGASILAGPVVERLLPEVGVAKGVAHIVGKAIDAYGGVQELTGPSEKENFEQAYQQALFNQLNGMTMQRSLSTSTPPVARGFVP